MKYKKATLYKTMQDGRNVQTNEPLYRFEPVRGYAFEVPVEGREPLSMGVHNNGGDTGWVLQENSTGAAIGGHFPSRAKAAASLSDKLIGALISQLNTDASKKLIAERERRIGETVKYD